MLVGDGGHRARQGRSHAGYCDEHLRAGCNLLYAEVGQRIVVAVGRVNGRAVLDTASSEDTRHTRFADDGLIALAA